MLAHVASATKQERRFLTARKDGVHVFISQQQPVLILRSICVEQRSPQGHVPSTTMLKVNSFTSAVDIIEFPRI